MEKPKCRLCGARHLGTEPHKFAAEKPEVAAPPSPPRVEGPPPSTNLRATASNEEMERALRFYRKHRECQRDDVRLTLDRDD